jgi:glycosyltransferase involved in cell wall biosynthesis
MDRVKILFDHQIFSMQARGGISRSYIELFRNYANDSDLDVRVAVGETLTTDLPETEVYKKNPCKPSFLRKKIYRTVRRYSNVDLLYYFNQRRSVLELNQKNFDIFQPTYYDPYFLPYLGKRPFYLLIHDMTHENCPEHFSKDGKVPKWKKDLAERANRIVTVSESTKRDVVSMLNIDPGKIQTIYLGCSLDPLSSKPEYMPAGIPSNYILFVGGRTGYKNFQLFCESVAKLMDERGDLNLVCVGGGPLTSQEISLLDRLKIRTRTSQWEVSDTELCQVYHNAMAFVYPSLYEGFGLPVLEAFKCGCPAILSDRSSLPELGGDAAMYFNPTEEDSIYEAIAKVVSDQDLRKRMVSRGMGRVQTFT